jgi:hypothetical protein
MAAAAAIHGEIKMRPTRSLFNNRRRSSKIVVRCIPKAAANCRFAAAGDINLSHRIRLRSMIVQLAQIPVDGLIRIG